ncbi:MAG TPA: isochorismatase family cysteine hydrolase [Caulobacteraceae bacterium]|nr:isochorismatase family cysteine hydrolase [Caulobacteraceae bacterium]
MTPVPHVEPAALAEMIEPAQCALLVIDVQEDFAGPQGAMARAGADMSGVAPALDKIEALVAAARGARATVAFARVVTTPDSDSKALKLLHARKGEPGQALALCRSGEPGAGYHRVAPRPGDIEVEKRLYNAFHGTSLEADLRSRGIDALVVVGFATHCCVDATCRDAFHRDFNVFVVSDATDSYSADAHWATLRALRASCALIVSTDAVLSAWRS